jgi:acetyl-CoA synthetase
MSPITSYEDACAGHHWEVPERYNIAADVCDKHPRDKPAMIHEDPTGTVRRITWGELQDDSNRFANVLAAHGVGRGDRVAMLLPPTPETAAAFFGTWKVGAILLSMSVLYGDDGIRHRLTDSGAKVLVTNQANADRMESSLVEQVLILDADLLSKGSPAFEVVDTSSEDPAQLYYSSGTTGLAKGILHAHRYILATRSSSTATTCRTASCSTEWASGRGRRGSRRCSGRGATARCRRSTSARAASIRTSSSTSSPATGSPTCSGRRPRSAR